MHYRLHCKNLKTGVIETKGLICGRWRDCQDQVDALNEEDAGDFEHWLVVEEPLVDAVLARWPGAKVVDVREPA